MFAALRRLFRSASQRGQPMGRRERDSIWIRGNGTFDQKVVGESHYQCALEHIAGGRSPDSVEIEVTATLLLEDSNAYDDQAVCVQIHGMTVGYLSRDDARMFRRLVAAAHVPQGVVFESRAQIRGGWDRGGDDRGSFGVWLDFSGA